MILALRWAADVAAAIVAVTLAAGIAASAVAFADRGDLSGVPGSLWGLAPALACVGAALAVGRWRGTGAWLGVASCGIGPARLALVAGIAASVLALAADRAGADRPPAPPWTARDVPGGIAWTGGRPPGREVEVAAGRIVAIREGAPSPPDPPRGADLPALASVLAWSAIGVLGAGRAPGGARLAIGASIAERVLSVTVAVAVRQGSVPAPWLGALPALALLAAVALAARANRLPGPSGG